MDIKFDFNSISLPEDVMMFTLLDYDKKNTKYCLYIHRHIYMHLYIYMYTFIYVYSTNKNHKKNFLR
jgi:hypothetical protein